MIVDTSAIMAIMLGEDDAGRFERAIMDARRCHMSTASFLEAAIVIESRGGAAAARELDIFLEQSPIELVSVTPDHALSARQAWRRFGRGNHPAALNFGDCFSYALAAATGEPLLFKGADFALTDIEDALDQR